jgi:hypothetical protein
MSGVSRNYGPGNGAIQRFEYDEKDEQVITQRFPQSAFLLIDSNDRFTKDANGETLGGGTNINQIYISHQRLNGFGEIRRIAITDIAFPWRTPNVNITNNFFYLTINGINGYLEVPQGFYKPSELALQLQTLANAPNGFRQTSTYPVNTYFNDGKPFTITSDAIGRFTITATGVNISAYITMPRVGPPGSLNNLMNYYTAQSSYIPAPTFTGGIPSMAYTKYIDFVSANLTKHQRLKDCLTQLNYTDIIYRLYLENENDLPLTDDTYFGSRPSNLYRQISNPKYIQWNKNEMISTIDIKLYDDTGNLLYVPFNEWDANYLLTVQSSES